jgi:hypothetical protein
MVNVMLEIRLIRVIRVPKIASRSGATQLRFGKVYSWLAT